MSNEEIEMKPVRVLVDLKDGKELKKRVRSNYRNMRWVMTIDPEDSKGIYGGRTGYAVGFAYYIWHNAIPFFVYEKSPRKLITGMVRLVPIAWLHKPKSEPGVGEVGTIRIQSVHELFLAMCGESPEGYAFHTVRREIAYSWLKDRIPFELFQKQAGKDKFVYVSEIMKAYEFESTYEPWMLGLGAKGPRSGFHLVKDTSEYEGEPWRVKLSEEIKAGAVSLGVDEDAIWKRV